MKITFTPYPLGQKPPTIGRPMTDEERACDCGCMEVEREPAGDLTFHADYAAGPKPAGVSSGYLVVRQRNSVKVADVALLHDGEGNAVGQIDHDTWRQAPIVDPERDGQG